MSARQRASGCAEPDPSAELATRAQQVAAMHAAGANPTSGDDAEELLYSVETAGPLAAAIFADYVEYSEIRSRIDRCDRFGIGHATTPTGTSIFAIVTTRRD